MAKPPLATHITGFPIPAARDMEMHRHPHVELVLCQAGSGKTRCADGQELRFAAGDVCVHPAHARHDRRYLVPAASLVLRLRVDPPLPPPLRRALLVRGPQPAWLLAEFTALAAAQPQVAGFARLALDHRASAVLCDLLARGSSDIASDPDAHLADRAARRIAERFANLGRLDTLAAELGVDYDRLRRVFRRQHGTTLIAWLTAVRARRAQELLANSGLSHAEIARQCGYASARYLSRIYRRHFGTAPRAIRR